MTVVTVVIVVTVDTVMTEVTLVKVMPKKSSPKSNLLFSLSITLFQQIKMIPKIFF